MSDLNLPGFKKGLDSALASAGYEEGVLLFTTDTGRLVACIDGERVEITDFVKKTEAEILSTLAPLPKIYLSTDTLKMYYYTDKWVELNPSDVASALKSDSADKLSNARTITISGGAEGNASFDGSKDIIISITVKNDSHNHSASTLPAASTSAAGIVKLGAAGGAAKYEHDHPDMTGASSSAAGTHGMVPAPAAGKQASFLRGDGTWAVPTNTTYSDMTGASASAAGAHGLVPAPGAGKQASFLRGDGTWAVPTDTKYTHPTYTARTSGFYKVTVDATGHVSTVAAVTKSDITGLGIPGSDTVYTHPSHDAYDSGLYKVTVDASGHVTAATAVTKSDITALGIPGSDTVYTHPTHTSKTSGFYKVTVDGYGHVSAATAVTKSDITALGIPGSDTVYTHPTHTAYAAGFYKVTVDASGHVTAATAVAKSDITALGIPGSDTKYTHPTHTSYTSGLYKITVDGYGHVTAATAVAKSDITALGIPGSDTNTTYSDMTGATSSAAGAHGLVPAPAKGDQTKFLRGDGTWVVPTDTKYTHPSYTARTSGFYKVTVDATGHVSAVTAVSKSDITALGIPGSDTTYSVMGAATSSVAGSSGLVPAPAAGKQSSFLRGDGTWAVPTDTKYTHPSYTAQSSGLYKITVDATGHVSAVTAVSKSDITALGIPGSDTNTTYSDMTGATSSAAGAHGLVPAPAAGKQSSFLRGDGTWAVPTNTKNTAGSTDSSDKLFLIGAASQAANPQTYSHDTAYVGTDGHLYSNSIQVVNLSGSQALTNKTYNGYTLAAACAKGVTDSTSAGAISTGTNLVTERDVYYGLPKINNAKTYTSDSNFYAPTAGGTAGYFLVGNGTTSAPVWTNDVDFGDEG